jgi:hypothetical protein
MPNATSISVNQLFAAVSQLSHAEIVQAGTPLPPFMPSDISMLQAQSDKVGEIAGALFAADPSSYGADEVADASSHVQLALSMFTTIQSNASNTLNRALVFGAVDAAIDSLAFA